MEETSLNYFRDKDDNYIIRRICGIDEGNAYFNYSGTFSSIVVIKKDEVEKEVGKLFEDFSDEIERNALDLYKVEKESFLFEKIIGNFVDEEKFNPLFSKMSKEDTLKFQGEGLKVKINLAFEIHVKVEKHLKFKAFKEMLLGRTQTNFR